LNAWNPPMTFSVDSIISVVKVEFKKYAHKGFYQNKHAYSSEIKHQ